MKRKKGIDSDMIECQYRHGGKQCHIPKNFCDTFKDCKIFCDEIIKFRDE